jgi:hypothetical protein
LLSIIISWRDRTELSRALPSLLAAARGLGGDVTVVNYSGSRPLLDSQLGEHQSAVRVVEVPDQRYFNKSSAQNLGAHHSPHPILFFCDCDIIVEPASIRQLVENIASRPGLFATLAGVRESEVNSRGGKHVVSFGYELKIRTADGRRLSIIDNEEDAENGTRQAPGLLFVRRSDFLGINGYNANLHGWGWEDQDMISRLTLGQGLERIMQGHAIHLSHDDHARVAHYPLSNRWESRDRMFRAALANYDEANFRGTYDRDVSTIPSQVRAA